MLRKRLIFTLIYNDNRFMQSRNFRLQHVGNINWLEKNYKFQKISFSLDELLIVDASKDEKNIENFSKIVERLVEDVFIPVTAGGGIRSLDDVELLFKVGADKIILNTQLYRDPDLAIDIISKYGSQSLVASVDYKIINEEPIVFINDGTIPIDYKLNDYINYLENIGVGEIILNSIDKDGTGFGYDLEVINKYGKDMKTPLIIMGGAGNGEHLSNGLKLKHVSAVATANLFNFIGNGLPNARKKILEDGINLANWDSELE